MRKILKKLCFTICIVLPTLILISCGGGSGAGSSNPTPNGPSNTTPTTPTVTMVQPTNNATNASISQVIELSFSEPVTNVTESTVTLHESGPTGITVPTTDIVLNGDGKSYTFSSTSHLIPSTKYYVVVGSGIKSVSGNIEVVPTNFNFQTSEYASPTVSMTNPADGSTNVSTSQNIVLQFSESVSNVTESTVVLHEGGPTGKVINTSITAVDASNYTFQPESLSGGTTYYVEVTNQITSTATGESLTPAEFSFTTSQSITSPTVVMLNPSNNGTTGSLNPDITIQFSESVEHLTTTSITLHEGSESGPKVEYYLAKKLTNNTYVFKPEESLALNTTYYLVLTNEITSVSTGAPLIPAIFNFATQTPNFLYIAAGNGVSVCPIIDATGNLGSCTLTISSKHAYKVAINPTHTVAYIVSKNDNSVTACTINPMDGTLSNCGTTGSGFNGPTSLSFTKDGSYAYVTNYSANKILVCSVAESSLTNCTNTGNISFSSPSSVAIDSNNGLAYITNSGSNLFNVCSVSNTDGTLSNCSTSGNGSYKSLMGIGLTANYLYSTSSGTGDVIKCQIDQTSGDLTCAPEPSFGIYNKLADITASEHNIYVADGGNGNISLCHQNESGDLTKCSYPSYNNVGLLGVTTLK